MSTITSAGFTTVLSVDATPDEAFAAITNVRGWWTGDIEGLTDELGGEFTYRYRDLHVSTQRVTELIPGKRVTWRVLNAELAFINDPAEWAGTDISFDIAGRGQLTDVRFTHRGLVPQFECFDRCSSAWGFFVHESLRRLIATGEGPTQPPWA